MKTLTLLVACALVLTALPALAQYGVNRSLDVPYIAPGTLKFDMKKDSVAWSKAAKIDMTANWDGAWSGHPTADIVSTGKLLWTTDSLFVCVVIEDFEPFYWGPPDAYNPWKGDQILLGVDATHARDTCANEDWGGWPENAPNKGPVTYKITKDDITINWGVFPVDSGWARGHVFVDTVNYVWGVEMALKLSEVKLGGKIGFNIGGANANRTWKADWDTTDHAYGWYSWLSAGSPGGDVMHVAKSFGTLNLINTNIYGMGQGLEVPYIAPGTLKFDMKKDSVAWSKAAKVDMTANWDGAWSGHPTADIVSTGKLLWTTDSLFVCVVIEDFEPFYWGPPDAYNPWKGDQILLGVDATHARDTCANEDWGGWPENAPNKGPVTYKITKDDITINWGVFPVDSGWARGHVFVDTVNYVWGVEMALKLSEVKLGGKIGFNIGGANANRTWKADWDTTDHAYGWYSWLSAGSPGGDVMHVARSFGTLQMSAITSAPGRKNGDQMPDQFTLYQNYPNPFNPSTVISYGMPHAGRVSLVIYDILGREVAHLIDGPQGAGMHEVQWNAGTLGTGMYFYRLRVDDRTVATKKLLLVK